MVGAEATAAASSHLAELLAAIDRFRQRPKTNRQPQELAGELKGIRHATDLLELEFSQTAAAFSKTEEYDEEGSVSPIDWIRHQCRMSTGAVWNSLAVGAGVTGDDVAGCNQLAVEHAGDDGLGHHPGSDDAQRRPPEWTHLRIVRTRSSGLATLDRRTHVR